MRNGEITTLSGAPVQRNQRLITLDVLRGVALLGILLLNVQAFAGNEAMWDIPTGLNKPAFVGWHTYVDYVLMCLTWMFGEGKMRGLFSVLFGAGVILFINRLEERVGSQRTAGIFYRRNLWLLFFGAAHGFLIWDEDILLYYACMALLFLYPVRHLSARCSLRLGLLLWIVGGSLGSLRFMHAVEILRSDAQVQLARAAGPDASQLQKAVLVDAERQQTAEAVEARKTLLAEKQGYLAGWWRRIQQEIGFIRLTFASFFVLEFLGAMLTGMALYKFGYLTNEQPRSLYVYVACSCYAISWTLVLLGLWRLHNAHFSAAADARWMSIPYDTEVATGTLANASILLLILRRGFSKALLSPIEAVVVWPSATTS